MDHAKDLDDLANLTPLERELLLRVQALQEVQSQRLRTQDQTIADLEAKVHGTEAAVTRLMDLLTGLLAPEDQRRS